MPHIHEFANSVRNAYIPPAHFDAYLMSDHCSGASCLAEVIGSSVQVRMNLNIGFSDEAPESITGNVSEVDLRALTSKRLMVLVTRMEFQRMMMELG